MTRRKKSLPVMLLWDRRSQARFIEAVEKLSSQVNDMERLLEPAKRRRAAHTPQLSAYLAECTEWIDRAIGHIEPGLDDVDQAVGCLMMIRDCLSIAKDRVMAAQAKAAAKGGGS